MRDRINRVAMVDSYKTAQKYQMPDGITSMASYQESRGSTRKYTKAALFALQHFLLKYFSEPIEQWEVDEAYEFAQDSNEIFPYEEWTELVKAGGKIPLRIRAVPEGQFIPLSNPLFTVESTDERFWWLVDWFETALCRNWYGGTVMTQSYYLRELIYSYLVKTSDDPEGQIPFKLHDFGARGASSHETAEIGGAAHLAIFRGSDTVEGIKLIKDYYKTWKGVRISITASQHSTITAWGKENEVDAYRNMLTKFSNKGIFACVSDSWNIYNACAKLWGGELLQEVIDSGAIVVIRPDSGDPIEVLFGTGVEKIEAVDFEHFKYLVADTLNNELIVETPHGEHGGDITKTFFFENKAYKVNYSPDWNRYDKQYYYIDNYGSTVSKCTFEEVELTDKDKGVFGILAEKFGTTTNSKGYKVLNHVRVIQGDGVNPDSIKAILEKLTELGYSTDNIAFGMGGALLQKVDRDVMKFAYKCSSVTVNGEERDVYKDPVTARDKLSKKGRLDVIQDDAGNIKTVKLLNGDVSHPNTIMRTVFENGKILVEDTFLQIIERASL